MKETEYKYKILIDYLKAQINENILIMGQKIPSENELAEKFGLSRFTVRHALEKLTAEGYLEKRHGSGTFVKNCSIQKRKTHVIGVITTYVDDYIFPNIIRGIEKVLSQNSYTISLGITYNKTEKELFCLKSMIQNNIDGLVIEGTKSALPCVNLDIINELKNMGIPLVFINGYYNNLDCSYIIMDDEKGGTLAAKFLIDNGHTKIGGIFKSDDIQGHKRYKGYVNSMHESGLAIDENAILWYTTEDIDKIFNKNYDRLIMERFENCTAIICYNDQIAVKVIDAIQRNGKKVPDDVSIISFDNSNLAEISSVKLTSISHAGNIMGEMAASALLDNILNAKQIKKKLSSSIYERSSVKNIK